MIQANNVMPAVIAAIVRKAPLTDEKVTFAWRLAVGPAIGRVTTVRLSSNGTLHVSAESQAWNDAISKSLGLIRSRLAHVLGDEAIKRVSFS